MSGAPLTRRRGRFPAPPPQPAGVQRPYRCGAVNPAERVVAVTEDGRHVVAPPFAVRVVRHADGPMAQYVGEQVGTVLLREDEQRLRGCRVVHEVFQRSAPGRRYPHHPRRCPPRLPGHHRAGVRTEAEQHHPIRAVTFPGELADVDLAGTGHIGGPGVPDMGVVRPHHRLAARPVVGQQPVKGVVHVPVPHVPRVPPATHHRPVVPFGAGDDLGVLPRREPARPVGGGPLPQPDQEVDHLVLTTGRHEPGGRRVPLRVLGIGLETPVRRQRRRYLPRIVLVQVDQDLPQRLPQRVHVQSMKADPPRRLHCRVVPAQPAAEVDDLLVGPHPRRPPLERRQRRARVRRRARRAPHGPVDPGAVRPAP